MPPVSRVSAASKVFDTGTVKVTAVRRADLEVSQGDFVGVVGPSGSGKSTLLSLMGALRLPTSGEAYFQEKNLGRLSSVERRLIRLNKIGFVFQQLKLIPTLSVSENIRLPMMLLGTPTAAQVGKSKELVALVGLDGKEERKPGELSVGEQQRVAVARALVNDPLLVLADEPTSQLDTPAALGIVELLRSLGQKLGAGVVISTHDQKIGESLQRVYKMRDGVLEG